MNWAGRPQRYRKCGSAFPAALHRFPTAGFRQTPNRISARSIEFSEMKSVCPAARASESQRRSLRASSSEEMRHAPVRARVTRQSGAPCVTSAACSAACSRKSSVNRRLISIGSWRLVIGDCQRAAGAGSNCQLHTADCYHSRSDRKQAVPAWQK